MREIKLNGYIDQELFWGDEITPKGLHEALYGETDDLSDDVEIVLNSYGGDCNAATQMYDEIKRYPGHVDITISGTAASAGTVIAQAADTLRMTPGSLFMIHDPLTMTWGNEKDHRDAIGILKTVKQSIINVYATRCTLPAEKIDALMTKSTWMDANEAKELGFVDEVLDSGVLNAVTEDKGTAERKVQAWFDRHRPVATTTTAVRTVSVEAITATVNTPETTAAPEAPVVDKDEPKVSVAELEKRLQACRYTY